MWAQGAIALLISDSAARKTAPLTQGRLPPWTRTRSTPTRDGPRDRKFECQTRTNLAAVVNPRRGGGGLLITRPAPQALLPTRVRPLWHACASWVIRGVAGRS